MTCFATIEADLVATRGELSLLKWMLGSPREETRGNSWSSAERKKTEPHQGPPQQQQPLPRSPTPPWRMKAREHEVETGATEIKEGPQRGRDPSRGAYAPNHPVHRIAARWRCCIS